MEIDKWEDETFKILNEVEESSETLRVIGFLDLSIGAYLRGGEIDFFITDSACELLFSNFIRFGPVLILTAHNSAIQNDSFDFVDDSLGDED